MPEALTPRLIVTRRPGICLTCEEAVEVGERVNWEPEIGIWCLDCPEPDNIVHYRRARDQAKQKSITNCWGGRPRD